jgi:hypothetical protein
MLLKSAHADKRVVAKECLKVCAETCFVIHASSALFEIIFDIKFLVNLTFSQSKILIFSFLKL